MEGKNVEVGGLIMGVSRRSPIYAACPNCRKKLEEAADGFRCPVCGSIPTPEYRMLYKVTLDDGSGTIPVTLFGSSAEQLIGITAQEAHEMIERSGNPTEPFDRNAHRILGTRIVIQGRVTKFRDTLEIAASSLLFPELSDEIQRERRHIESLMQ